MNDNLILQKNQTNFLEFSQNICPDKNGFLLYHHIGTGKTITALSWAMNYPDKKINIIGPGHTKLVWDRDIDKIGIRKKIKFKFISWGDFFLNPENYEKNIKDSLLILDESHHLSNYFINTVSNLFQEKGGVFVNKTIKKKNTIYSILKKNYKILCMSATPIVNNFTDLAYIINLVSNNKVIPFDNKKAIQKYGTIKKSESLEFKSITRRFNNNYFHNFKIFSIDTVAITAFLAGLYSYVYKPLKKQYYGTYKAITNDFSGDVKAFEKATKPANWLERWIDKWDNDFFLKKMLISHKAVEDKVKLGIGAVKERHGIKGETGTLIEEGKKLEKYASDQKKFLAQTGKIAMLITLIYIMYLVMHRLYIFRRYSDEKKKLQIENDFDIKQFFIVDHKKLAIDIGHYVHYYYPSDENLKKYYPYVSEEIIFSEYDTPQNMILIELITNNLSNENLKLIYNEEETNFIDHEKLNSLESFLKLGRVISDLTFVNKLIINQKLETNSKNIYGFKLRKELNYDFNKILQFLPEKYKFLIKNITKPNNKSVIYSNFYVHGFKTLSIILNLLGIKHYVFHRSLSQKNQEKIIDLFNNNKSNIKILLLSPKNNEGIELKSVKSLHILEPISNSNSRMQLISRCVRKNSHTDLPINKRSIKIYDYITKQAVLIHGKFIILKDEIDKLRKFEKSQLKKIKITNPKYNKIKFNIEILDKKYAENRKKSRSERGILTGLISSIFEPIIGNKMKSGDTKIELIEFSRNLSGPNKKLLNHISGLIHSNNGNKDLFDTYNFMYGPIERRRKFLMNPDENAYLKCENERVHITLFEKHLESKEIREICNNFTCPSCTSRSCSYWLPNKPGNCYRKNK